MGDYDEAAKLCEAETGRLIGYLVTRGTSRHEAEEIVQDTFLVVCRKGRQVTSHPNPTAYLYKIARGIARDRQRSDSSRCANEIRAHLRTTPSSEEPGATVPLHVDVQKALAQLSERQREIVYLHRCADMVLEDVAGVLDLALGTVKEHLRRAEQRLRKLLRGYPRGEQA